MTHCMGSFIRADLLRPARRLTPTLVAILAVGVSGCGATGHSGSADTKVVRVGERDFHIAAPLSAGAGHVVLRARNTGPDMHELIVVRAPNSDLPLRADGVTVNEEALQHAEAGVLESGQPGSVRDLSMNLAPGRYVLFCNMSGHYLGGMHASLVVTG